jgi:hypothetical protein
VFVGTSKSFFCKKEKKGVGKKLKKTFFCVRYVFPDLYYAGQPHLRYQYPSGTCSFDVLIPYPKVAVGTFSVPLIG